MTTARSFEGAAGAWFTVVRVLPREAGSRATLVARVNSERSIGLKVFAATKARERGFLGETITDWIRLHAELDVFEKIVTQSSDAEFHCLAITLVYWFDGSPTTAR